MLHAKVMVRRIKRSSQCHSQFVAQANQSRAPKTNATTVSRVAPAPCPRADESAPLPAGDDDVCGASCEVVVVVVDGAVENVTVEDVVELVLVVLDGAATPIAFALNAAKVFGPLSIEFAAKTMPCVQWFACRQYTQIGAVCARS